MTATHIPATVTHADMVAGWMRNPAFRAEYERLEREEGSMLDSLATLRSMGQAKAGAAGLTRSPPTFEPFHA